MSEEACRRYHFSFINDDNNNIMIAMTKFRRDNNVINYNHCYNNNIEIFTPYVLAAAAAVVRRARVSVCTCCHQSPLIPAVIVDV